MFWINTSVLKTNRKIDDLRSISCNLYRYLPRFWSTVKAILFDDIFLCKFWIFCLGGGECKNIKNASEICLYSFCYVFYESDKYFGDKNPYPLGYGLVCGFLPLVYVKLPSVQFLALNYMVWGKIVFRRFCHWETICLSLKWLEPFTAVDLDEAKLHYVDIVLVHAPGLNNVVKVWFIFVFIEWLTS